MTILLAIIAALEAVVIVCLYRMWHNERERYYFMQGSSVVIRQHMQGEIAELRETINKARRNTGKAEM